MANSVTFPEALGGNGQTYTDDADPDTGLDGLGYTVRFIPCLQQAVAMGLSAQSSAEAAADYVQQCQTLRQEVATDRQAVADDRTHVNQQKGLVDDAAEQVGIDKQAVADDRTHVDQQKGLVDDAAEQVGIDKQAVTDDRTHVDQQKGLVDDAAEQVAIDKQAVADDRLASQQAAGASSDAAVASIQARDEAEALYGDLNAVETAKTEAQQAATSAGQQREQAETARGGAEAAQEAAETAASESQGAADAAITDLKDNFLGAAAEREAIGPEEAPLMAQGYGGIGVTSFLADADAPDIPTGFYKVENASFADPTAIASYAFDATLIHINTPGQTDQYLRLSSGDMLSRINDGPGYEPWAKTYTQRSILGAVGVDGNGFPNGGVIERGSNSDGSYTKLAGNLMIQRTIHQRNSAQGAAAAIAHQLPQPFPSVSDAVTNHVTVHADLHANQLVSAGATARMRLKNAAVYNLQGLDTVRVYFATDANLSAGAATSFGYSESNILQYLQEAESGARPFRLAITAIGPWE